MAVAIGDILTPALGVALSPFPVVAVILMLTSSQGRIKGTAFVVGWALGLVAVVGLLLIVASQVGIEPADDGPSTTASLVRLLLGVGLLGLAAKNVRSRPKAGETPPMPDWMASIEGASPAKACAFGAMLSGLNPKNLMFNLIAGTAIASSGASAGGEIAAWAVYILLASATVLAPVLWYLASPGTAVPRLEQSRHWLIRNSGVLIAVMLLVIGVSQIGEAITHLGA